MEQIKAIQKTEIEAVLEILELVADPKEAKKAAKELSDALALLRKSEAQDKIRKSDLDRAEAANIRERERLGLLSSEIESQRLANLDNLAGIESARAHLASREAVAQKEDLRLQGIVADVQSREQALSQREIRLKQDLERETQRHVDAARDFQEKTAKLKKIMGE